MNGGWLAAFCISVICILQLSGQEVITIKKATTTGHSYYLGEPLTVTCKSSAIEVDGIYTMYIQIGTKLVFCSRVHGVWYVSGKTLDIPIEEPVDNSDCNLYEKDNTMTLKLNIVKELSSRPITCLSTANETPTSPINVKPILISPRNLMLSVDKDPVVENETITVSCHSDSPNSSYLYELVRQSGEVTSLPGGSYITSPADRDGFSVRCTEQRHSDWPYEVDLVNTKEIRPHYISRNWDQAELRSEDKNPESPTPLGCYIEGYPTPTYSWTSNLTDITSTQSSMLSFSNDSRKIGSAEEITCIGTVGKGGLSPLSITWRIIWKEIRSTNTNPPIGAVIGGALGGVALLLIVIIGIWYWKKQKGQHNHQLKPAIVHKQPRRKHRQSHSRKWRTKRSVVPTGDPSSSQQPQTSKVIGVPLTGGT